MATRQSIRLSRDEIQQAFKAPMWSKKYPPILSVEQASELLQVPKHTIYQWSSEDRLRGCAKKAGKRLLFFRDRLIEKIFNEGV